MACIGVVKKYDAAKGFGFIVPSEGFSGQDLFVLRTDIIGGMLVAGDQVNYDEGFNERNGNTKAVNVTGGTGGMMPDSGKGGFGGKGKSKGGSFKGNFESNSMMQQGGLGGGCGFSGIPGACAGGLMGGGFSNGNARGGTVKFFNDSKGFGFISPDTGEPDLFVHRNDVQGQELMEGDRVQYTEAQDDRSGRPKAQQVTGGTGNPIMNSGKGGGKGGKGKKGGKGREPGGMLGGPGPMSFGGQGCAPGGGQPGPMGPGGMQPGLGMMTGAGGLGMMQGGSGHMGQGGMAGLAGMTGMGGGFPDSLPERGGMMARMPPQMFDDDFAPSQACGAGKGYGAPGPMGGGSCMQGMFDRFGPGGASPQGIGGMMGGQPQPGQGGQPQLGQGGLGGQNLNFGGGCGGGMQPFSMGGGSLNGASF